MCPKVIADSDDESDVGEGYSPLPSPRPQPVPAATIQVPTRSLDQESLTTASTDSTFFQNVYNEQNDAARRQSLPLQSDAVKEDMQQSSAVTIPDVPYQRTTKGFYNSSMTSITEPNTDRYQNMSSGGNLEPTQPFSSDRRRGRGSVQPVGDPWEVPSSPENPRVSNKSRKRVADRREASKLGRGAEAQNHSAMTDGSEKSSKGDEKRGTKRRRLREPSQSPLGASNNVDLIVIDSSNEIGPHALDHDGTILTPHTHIQPFTPMRNNNLLLQQQTLYTAGSSGTTTNVNTPRSCTFKSQNIGTSVSEDFDGKIVAKTGEHGALHSDPDSSPDVMSLKAPKAAEFRTVELERETFEGQATTDLNESASVVVQSNECCAEVVTRNEAVVKPKKRRGRPKKNEESDETGGLVLETEAAPTSETSKKKRGRPKKKPPSDPADPIPFSAANTSTLVGVLGTNLVGDVDGTANVGSNGAKTKDTALIDKLSHDDSVGLPKERPTLPVEEKSIQSPSDSQDEVCMTKKGGTGLRPGTPGVAMEQQKEQESPKDAKPLKQGVAPKRETRLAHSDKGKASPIAAAAKPPLRVGLSKRLKIAPLLKSVRK